jgi:excisionase family DNA binding protein
MEWGCSERHIRNLVAAGELRAFRLGRKLLRITSDAVEEFKCRTNTASDDCVENASSSSTRTVGGADIDSAPLMRVKLNAVRQRSTPS